MTIKRVMNNMKCPNCSSTNLVKNGKGWDRAGQKVQRYRCNDCGYNTLTPKVNETEVKDNAAN